MVTRAVVLMTMVEDTAPVLGMVSGVVVNEQLAPVGKPEEQESDTCAV